MNTDNQLLKEDILDIFIKEIKDEFKDSNWDYLTFIAERVRDKNKKDFVQWLTEDAVPATKDILNELKVINLTKENEQLKQSNRELLEALKDIVKINAAPTLDLLIDKLKNKAKEAITNNSK